MLEVIEKGSCTDAHPVPLLFVHGAWHAAWCWDEHFLDFFAARGYRALALSLRGHGSSATSKPLHSCSITDYVEDVVAVADSLPAPPVVIGHSMGGGVVQKYLESHAAPAAVLVASLPPGGAGAALLRFVRRHPWVTVKSLLTGDTTAMVSPGCIRECMFSPHTPEALIAGAARRLQEESRRVIYRDLISRSMISPHLITVPLLVLGAEHDGVLPTGDLRATARAYRTEPEVFLGMGHDMMLEPGWSAVAERIDGWLDLGPDA